MSIFGMMRTSVTGLTAQASKLATVGDNIANASTTGYKRAFVDFSSLVLHNHGGQYTPGGVETSVRYGVSQQGALSFTSSGTDLAVSGNGFLLVSDGGGQPHMTRAGSFVLDGNRQLMNSAGLKLLAYPISGGATQPVINGAAGLVPVDFNGLSMTASASQSGVLSSNFPADANIVAAADLPSANAASAVPSAKTSAVVYDSLGREIVLDVYVTKTAAETFEVAVFDRADAGPDGGFPYSSAPLSTSTMTFDPSNGQLATGSPTSIAINVPNGATLTLDMSRTSQLATDFEVSEIAIDGNGPADVSGIDFARDGTLYAIYENGARVATYRVPLANVPSPDNLTPSSGNTFALSADSGDLMIGFPDESGLGGLVSGALEQSTVDIASELTSMIEAQRSYTANSKVFQTASELLDVLNNLKR